MGYRVFWVLVSLLPVMKKQTLDKKPSEVRLALIALRARGPPLVL
jgi:hypothetical protein